MTEKDVLKIISKDEWMMEVLRTVKVLNLPDWMIGGGFIRSKVWDWLHGYTKRTPLPDIDVTYFDVRRNDPRADKKHVQILKECMPGVEWSVGNAAYLHMERGDPPYTSSTQSLEYWVETATAVGITMDENDKLTLFAPYGVDDLINLIVRQIPNNKLRDKNVLRERVRKKMWKEKWPKLKILYE